MLNKKNIGIILLSSTIVTFFLLIFLGIWQIFRLHEKESFLSKIKTNIISPAIDINSLSTDQLYAKVRLKGYFLQNKNIHLYGRRSMSAEKDGYYLITPFQLDSGKVILVARGWFCAKNKKEIDIIVDSSATEITGIIAPGEKGKIFTINNDLKNNVWFTLDLRQASDHLTLKLEDFYIIMDNDTDSPILKNLSTKSLLNIKNDHLEYAITWFALAFSLAIIFTIYAKQKQNDTNNIEDNMKLKIGDTAPSFSMKTKDTQSISLSDLKGKFIVLYFYPKDDTPGCTVEAGNFNKLKADFTKANAVIIGVSKDSIDSHEKFKQKYCLEFGLVSDDSDICERYGTWGEKSLFGKKYMGITRATFLINPNGEIAYIWPKVQVRNHAEEVLNQIKKLS